MTARDEILSRIREAVSDVTTAPRDHPADDPPAGDQLPVPGAESSSGAVPDETLDLFVDNVADYRATVVRTTPEQLDGVLADVLSGRGCRSVAVPTGLDPSWLRRLPDTVVTVAESETTGSAQLDTIDAVVTTATVGIAVTGTIVLDHGPGQGRRELTLVPDTHVCVLQARDIVHDVSDAVARLRPGPGGARPLTWVSGPSATSDIELERVEGVHGPRTLVVVLVADSPRRR
jgi:L-lactate dehydrogenase complex protein LldG